MIASPSVLFVITSTNRRGAEVEGSDVAVALARRGLDCTVVALAPGCGTELLDVDVLGPSERSLSTLRALRRRARCVDLVVAYGSSTLPACALALAGSGPPFIYRSIGDPGRWVRSTLHRSRTGQLMRRAAHIVALWPGAGEAIHTLYGVPAEDISVIANGRDATHFLPPTAAQRKAARSKFGLDGEGPVAVILGSLSEEKCVHIGLNAAASVPGLRVLVIGDGPCRSELELLAARTLRGRIQFSGSLRDVMPTLHASDVMLLTSRTEGLPGALIEAGMCGLASVATNVGGVGQIVIDTKTGILVRVGDVEAVAAGVITALEHQLSMSNEARVHCETRFATELTLDHWERLVQRWAIR